MSERRGPRSPADSKGPDWRKLEQSRDWFRGLAGAWQQQAVRQFPREVGLDLPETEARLLTDEFTRAHQHLEPERAVEAFTEFASAYGYNPNPRTAQQVQDPGGGLDA